MRVSQAHKTVTFPAMQFYKASVFQLFGHLARNGDAAVTEPINESHLDLWYPLIYGDEFSFVAFFRFKLIDELNERCISTVSKKRKMGKFKLSHEELFTMPSSTSRNEGQINTRGFQIIILIYPIY